MSLKVKKGGKFVEVSEVYKTFRGEWVTDTKLGTVSFDSTGLPSSISTSVAGNGSVQKVFASPVGSPFAQSMFLRVDAANDVHEARAILDISDQPDVSRVSYMAVGSPRTNHAYGAYVKHRALAGGEAWAPKDMTYVWQEYSIPVGAASSVTIWVDAQYGPTTALSRTEMGLYVNRIDLFGRTDPYMSGQFVTHDNKMWKSEVDNNGSVPGADALWTETLALPRPSGTTAERPDAATAGASFQYYDTTLGKPIWSNGTAWTDAAGTAV